MKKMITLRKFCLDSISDTLLLLFLKRDYYSNCLKTSWHK